MTENSRKYFSNMMPYLIARRGRPVDDVTDINGRDISRFAIRVIRPNRATKIAKAIRTYLNHFIRNTIIVIIIDNLIARVSTMVSTMRNFFFVPRSLPFIIRYLIIRTKYMIFFPIICLIDLAPYAPARSDVLIRSEFLKRNPRLLPHFLHINQPP